MKLLSDVTAGKMAWQTYTVKHGIEMIEVLVPLKNTQVFEQELKTAQTKAMIMEIVQTNGGKLK